MAKETPASVDWWAWALHEDKLVDSRLAVFITANGLLVTAAGFAVGKTQPSRPFLYLVCLLGIALGVLWLIVQVQSARIVSSLEDHLGPGFDEIFEKLSQSRWFFLARNKLMSYALPPIFTCWWGGLACAVRLGAFN